MKYVSVICLGAHHALSFGGHLGRGIIRVDNHLELGNHGLVDVLRRSEATAEQLELLMAMHALTEQGVPMCLKIVAYLMRNHLGVSDREIQVAMLKAK